MFGFGYEPLQKFVWGVENMDLEVRNLFSRIMFFFSNKTSTTTRTAEDAKARISLASEEKPLLYP